MTTSETKCTKAEALLCLFTTTLLGAFLLTSIELVETDDARVLAFVLVLLQIAPKQPFLELDERSGTFDSDP